jgi:hypothetical protein
MAMTTRGHEEGAKPAGASTRAPRTTGIDGARPAARLTSEQVWRALTRASFAVVSHVTPAGAPRSSGVVYTVVGRRLYVAVALDSWKAKHIAIGGRVAVTVPVRRGGVLSLLMPIPPATISFQATAIVHRADSASDSLAKVRQALGPLLPDERRATSAIIEIIPEGHFLTYGVGVSLMQMRDPTIARARVPVT